MMCFGVKERKRAKTNHCVIVLLDDTQLVHELHASSTGQDLLNVVIKHLNLLETSYFGLRYMDSGSSSSAASAAANFANNRMEHTIWLDVNKSAIKQLRNVQPMTVYFGVKYYAADPCKLAEEITRYQFFLQCKQDILHSRLPISFDLAIELFAMAVQSELGDYDPQRHHDGYVSEFQFLPNQSLELEKRVSLFHRTLTGQVPATAELNFLERVKWLDLYGCELHPIQYEDNGGEEYAMGLNPSGVLVLRNKLKVAHYLWPRIVKTKCQGRCFLMDVIDSSGKMSGGSNGERNRFGFRLADKAASRRLRWAIEEHKSFYHLIHSTATLNQLAQRQHQQQQQMNLSQRFRNSIRSAISVGPLSSLQQQQQHMAAQHHQQSQKLRSSMKSLSSEQQRALMQQHQNHQQQQYALDSRQPPTVVRMPSRRYSNRSLTRGPYGAYNSNGNGLPGPGLGAAPAPSLGPQSMSGLSHTMVDGQRQQAMMMMNHMNQMNSMLGKSQTLKPMPSKMEAKEAKKNPYYQMMMMMAATGQHHPAADVAILPPGQHIVQPSVYKASSVMNGLNHLGHHQAGLRPGDVVQQQRNSNGSVMQQFFNTRPQYSSAGHHASGHESPRSTKSAMAPSSALKLASKKLARQQQLLYGNQQDVQPLLAYDPIQQQQMYGAANSNNSGAYYGLSLPYSNSANPSPRSVRSARMASRHKSKSTNENLHLLHTSSNANPTVAGTTGKYMHSMPMAPVNFNTGSHQGNKMLLATAQLVQQQLQQNLPPPPPGYHANGTQGGQQRASKQRSSMNSDNESELSKRSAINKSNKKRTTFALDSEQANLLLNTNGLVDGSRMSANGPQACKSLTMPAKGHHQRQPSAAGGNGPSDGEDDYYCSRSDCSSVDDEGASRRRPMAAAGSPQAVESRHHNQSSRGPVRLMNGQVGAGGQQRRQRRLSASQQQEPDYGQHQVRRGQHVMMPMDDHQEWNAIRRRHNEFSSGKGFLGQANQQQQLNDSNHLYRSNSPLGAAYEPENGGANDRTRRQMSMYEDHNNNKSNTTNNGGSQLVKSIANKQATPILLSLNYDQTNANNKAVQLLNLQRQQLNSQSSDGTKSSSSALDSAPSSVASSPQAASSGKPQQQQPGSKSNKTSDSTASSSTTTSGYYAGTNSTGSASLDSDSPTNVDGPHSLGGKQQQVANGLASGKADSDRHHVKSNNYPPFNDWQNEGTRAKIALGSYAGSRMSGSRLLIGHQSHLKAAATDQRQPRSQKFYLGETNNNNEDHDDCLEAGQHQASSGQQQWSPLGHQQPSSLKYVSFDV